MVSVICVKNEPERNEPNDWIFKNKGYQVFSFFNKKKKKRRYLVEIALGLINGGLKVHIINT